MRLDEKGLEAATDVLLLRNTHVYKPYVRAVPRSDAEATIEAYLSAIVPGDVRELVHVLEHVDKNYLVPESHNSDVVKAAITALLSLSAENAGLKARLDGTVGVEHIGKAG